MRRIVGTILVASVSLVACLASGCGGSETPPTSTDGVVPPPRVTGGAPTSNKRTFAMKKLFLGDTTRSDTKTLDAWRDARAMPATSRPLRQLQRAIGGVMQFVEQAS